jgi:cytoskeletal protein RodZ
MFQIGSSLREARSRLGLDLEEVEERTAIRARYLAAIEDERFAVLPEGLYRRSFLREYAEFLGLDGDVYVTEYVTQYEPGEPEPPLTLPQRRRNRMPTPTLVKVSATLAGVAVVGVAIWGLGLGGTEPKRERLAANARPAAPARVGKPPEKRRAPRAAATQPSRATSIVLTASRGRCWLSVHLRSRDGPVVFERTVEEGQTVRFGLQTPLWIRMGAPENLDATMRGTAVALPGQVANVMVTSTGLQTVA